MRCEKRRVSLSLPSGRPFISIRRFRERSPKTCVRGESTISALMRSPSVILITFPAAEASGAIPPSRHINAKTRTGKEKQSREDARTRGLFGKFMGYPFHVSRKPLSMIRRHLHLVLRYPLAAYPLARHGDGLPLIPGRICIPCRARHRRVGIRISAGARRGRVGIRISVRAHRRGIRIRV